jgi:hypothetical protein
VLFHRFFLRLLLLAGLCDCERDDVNDEAAADPSASFILIDDLAMYGTAPTDAPDG